MSARSKPQHATAGARRRGRPPLSPEARASALIQMRIAPALKTRYLAAAARARMPLTRWIVTTLAPHVE